MPTTPVPVPALSLSQVLALTSEPSPEHLRLQALARRLDACRAELAAWRVGLERWHGRYHAQVVPLFEQRSALEGELLQLLDEADARHRLTRSERLLVSEAIRELAGLLIGAGRSGLQALYERHRAEPAHEDARADAHDDGDMPVLEDWELALREQERQRERARQAHARGRSQARARRVARAASPSGELPPVRVLYRKLAAALHPDREHDPDERARKTALMQRLNAAHAAGDLFGLVELQLEIGLESPERLRTMDAGRVAAYADTLAGQLDQAEDELRQMAARFQSDYGLALKRQPRPDRLDALLAGLKRGLADENAWLTMLLGELQDGPTLKRWLRERDSWASVGDDEDAT